jgi:arylsulfatase A-like enzyme
VFDEDWDTLVVLDACRYDMFESTSQLDGSLSSRTSKGSSTVEWLEANFDGRDLRDTVYVTANPQLEQNRERWDIHLHKTINVWLEDGWDDEIGTVRAETMTKAALRAAERFPHKRLVVHYMQPHYPFVPADTDFDKEHLRQIDGEGNEPSDENVWNQKFTGSLDMSREELWSMYTDNLEYVLEHVVELLDGLSGKSVITADHGNYVGERASPIPINEWGHPRGLYDAPVVQVPWLVSETGERRQIVASSGDTTTDGVETDVVAERLQDLGYRE